MTRIQAHRSRTKRCYDQHAAGDGDVLHEHELLHKHLISGESPIVVEQEIRQQGELRQSKCRPACLPAQGKCQGGENFEGAGQHGQGGRRR
ncbi:hypothetical protein D3C80_1009010 [compost metagenome]